MRARGAVVGAVGEVLLRSSAELGVRQNQRVIPFPELVERASECDDAAGQLAQQLRVSRRLAAVRVEPAVRDTDHRDARLIGDDLGCRFYGVAESGLRELGPERVIGVEMRCGLYDVRFDLQNVCERLVS